MHQHVLASSNFLLPNWTFVVELIAFLLILLVLHRYIVPPVQKAMRERQEIIRQQMEDSDKAKELLQSAEDQFKSALTDARTEAERIKAEARAEALRIAADVRAEAEEQSDRIKARGEEHLARQRDIVERELRDKIGALAVELAGKIMEQRLTDDSQVRGTVDTFLADLEHSNAAVPSS